MNFDRILSRVIVGVIIALILGAVRKAAGADITAHGWSQFAIEYSYISGFPIKVELTNPSGSPVTVSSCSVPYSATTYGSYSSVYFGNVGTSTFTIPAGGSVLKDISMTLSTNTSTGYGPWNFNKTLTFNAVVGGVTKTLTKTVSLSLTSQGGSTVRSMTPSSLTIGSLAVASPAPSGKVTVTANAEAAGSRSYTWTPPGGSASAPVAVTLATGSNVVVNTSSPSSIADGSLFKVYQPSGSTQTVIGQGTVAKDSFGNFDLAVTATGLPVLGLVVVMGQLGLSGPARLSTGGFTGYSTFTLNGTAGQQFEQLWNPASQVTAGAYLKVEWNPQVEGRDWMTVATSNVTKAPDGSFAISMTISGNGDPPAPNPTDAVFKLDAISYDPGAKIVQLEIDGVLYSPTPSAIGGDPDNGTHSVHTVTIAGGGTNMAGKSYKWVVSGSLDGVAVQRKTVAFGVAPAGPMIQQGEFLVGQGFEAVVNVTLGQPTYVSPDLPPANPYDPNAAPNPAATPEETAKAVAKKDDYESTNKAVADALKGALDAGTGSSPGNGPGSGEAEKLAAQGKAAAGKFADAVTGAKGKVGGFSSGSLSGQSSSLTVNLPVYGAAVLDLAPYDPWPGLARSILLGWFSWLASVTGVRIFRSAFAG